MEIRLFRLPRRSPLVLGALAMLGAMWSSTPVRAEPRGAFPDEDLAIIEKKWPDAIRLPSGLRYVVLQEGSGNKPLPRQRLSVLYRGTLLDGTEFSSMLDPEHPFTFKLGAREVILGWEEAFADMRVGEKRVLIIPYALGYGLRGRPPDIPNRATLVFEVELIGIE